MLKINRNIDFRLTELLDVVCKCLSKDMECDHQQFLGKEAYDKIESLLSRLLQDLLEDDQISIYTVRVSEGMSSEFDEAIVKHSLNEVLLADNPSQIEINNLINNKVIRYKSTDMPVNNLVGDTAVVVSDSYGLTKRFVKFNHFTSFNHEGFKWNPLHTIIIIESLHA